MIFLLFPSTIFAESITRYGSDFKIQDSEISFKVSDRLGAERLSFDSDNLTSEFNNLPYGQQLKNSNVKFGFNGKELDNTDSYYFNARYYNFDSGKFLGVDPVSDNHAYAFVSNNPMNYVDPSGMDPSNENINKESDGYWTNVLEHFIVEEWGDMIRDDVPEINSVSEVTGVPAEAILSAMLVEDIRFYAPNREALLSKSFLKAKVRDILPNSVLEFFGHLPNPPVRESSYGLVRLQTIEGAVNYLKTIDNPDEGTKMLLSKVSSVEYSSHWPTMMQNTRSCFSNIERVALVLKAHMVFWEKNGFDLFESEFNTIESFSERVGVLETLNSIYHYDSFPASNSEKFIGYRKDQFCEPHISPLVGGSILWDSVSYGELSRIFVNSGLATQISETDLGSSITRMDISDE